jgi:hypothetical protein
MYAGFATELRARLSVGVYQALALRDAFHGVPSNPDSSTASSNVPLAQREKERLGGALHTRSTCLMLLNRD